MNSLTLLGDLAPVGLIRLKCDAAPSPSDLTLANLEVPCCNAGLAPSPKSGPHLRAEPALMAELARAFAPLVVSLANNHLMDFGPAGLEQTLAAARATGVRTVGAGFSRGGAAAPLIMELRGRRIGVVAATDRWFGAATPDTAGVAALEPELVATIRRLQTEVDLVVASVHGGGEVSPWPAPRWQQHLRLLAESGAHLVHAHHPHVPLGWECWAGSWIFYGMGNTIVNPALWPAPAWTRRSWRAQLDPGNLHLAPRISEWEVMPHGVDGAELRCLQLHVPDDSPVVADLNAPLADPLLLEGLHQEYAVRLWNAFYADRVNQGDTAARRTRLTVRTLRDGALALFRSARWRTLQRDRGLFHYHLFSAATHADEIATALGVLHGERPDRRNTRTRRLAGTWLPASLFAS